MFVLQLHTYLLYLFTIFLQNVQQAAVMLRSSTLRFFLHLFTMSFILLVFIWSLIFGGRRRGDEEEGAHESMMRRL